MVKMIYLWLLWMNLNPYSLTLTVKQFLLMMMVGKSLQLALEKKSNLAQPWLNTWELSKKLINYSLGKKLNLRNYIKELIGFGLWTFHPMGNC